MTELAIEHRPLPTSESLKPGARIGEVNIDICGTITVNLGGAQDEHLTPYDTATLRNGAVHVDMYTINGRTDADYAVITMTCATTNISGTERAIALRTGSTKPKDLIERTPVQQFICRRNIVDIPLSGKAKWLALSPDGEFLTGQFDDTQPESYNSVAMFGEGWTFAWIMEGSRPFVFGELCTPRYIDSLADCPTGEMGVQEDDFERLPPDFRALLTYYQTGEQLRVS